MDAYNHHVKEMNLSQLIQYQDNYLRLKYIKEHRRDIVPFVGAGISKECGLYLWGELLDALAEGFLTKDEIVKLHGGNYFEYADKIVEAIGNPHLAMKRIGELFAKRDIKITNSVKIILNSFSPLLVTTNYDDIIEKASMQFPGSKPLKALLPCLKGQIDEAIQVNDHCLLKLHGSVEETTSFILTTDQYERFYGKRNSHNDLPLPLYLEKIFSGHKVLFIGCSLGEDRTMDILRWCVEKYENFSHYAIVPFLEDEEDHKRLSRLGISPIYYPEGDYKAVEKLLCYVAEEQIFLSVINRLIIDKISEIKSEKSLSNILSAVLCQSYYETSDTYPEILDDNYVGSTKQFEVSVKKRLDVNKKTDTLFSLIEDMFKLFIDSRLYRDKSQIENEFKKHFSNNIIKESIAEDVLHREWSLDLILGNTDKFEVIGVKRLTKKDYNDFACDLLEKLQYKNGMSYADILPVLNTAQNLIEKASDIIDLNIVVRLLNSIGYTLMRYKDLEGAEKYLRKSLEKMYDNPSQNRKDKLFLAKVYHNLSIVLAYQGKDKEAMSAIAEDIRLKNEYNEEPQLLSRSLNFYATLLKEYEPLEAGNVYINAAEIKEKYVVNYPENTEQDKQELIASWATTVFNIGLLLRDLELYEDAWTYVCWANTARWKTVDPCNIDYCNSLNVQAELEVMLYKKELAFELLKVVESKENLPEGFTKLLGHSWYVCALYYYKMGDYVTAYEYIYKSLCELQNESGDVKQILRSKMLFGSIIQRMSISNKERVFSKAVKIYKEVLEDAVHLYGEENYFLCKPYRFLMKNAEGEKERQEYEEKYNFIQSRFLESRNCLSGKVKDYWKNSLMHIK